MTVLPKRRVGKTKLEVTTLGLGGAPMGGFRAKISDAEAMALTDAAYDGGVRYFDTSPFYGYGRSELRMGAALREKPRDDFVLSTKIGRILHAMKPGEKPVVSSTPRRSPRVETNAAAFAYCKYAMLYFVALLVTWVRFFCSSFISEWGFCFC